MSKEKEFEKGTGYIPAWYIPFPNEDVNQYFDNGIPSGTVMQLQSSGEGTFKCHPKGTKVLMYDGTTKDVSKIKVGDTLMGPDSKPRTVLETGTGKEQCYEINPTKGESWECNESHILELVKSESKYSGETVSIKLKDYLKQCDNYKQHHLLFRSDGIKFRRKPLHIDPYFLGLWLGDGTSSKETIEITNADKEVIKWLQKYGKSLGITVNTYNREGNGKAYVITLTNATNGCQKVKRTTKEGKVFEYESMAEAARQTEFSEASISRWSRKMHTPRSGEKWEKVGEIKLGTSLSKYFKELDLINNKHIPHKYKTSSREQRLKLLAGLIDSDGSLETNGAGFTISQSNKEMAKDIKYVARSLGFASYMNEYINKEHNTPFWIISIHGYGIENIPTKINRKRANPRKLNKDPLRTGFEVTPTEIKKYYGFTLDKDQLYLLKDFTVTHNSSTALQLAGEAQKQGLDVAYIDAENAVTWQQDPDNPEEEICHWFEQLGVDSKEVYYRPTDYQEVLYEEVKTLIVDYDVKFIILDSIHAMQPEKIHNKDAGDSVIGLQAKIHGLELVKLVKLLKEHDATLCGINHKKAVITDTGSYGEKAVGGKGWGFYSQLIIVNSRTTSKSQLEDKRIIDLKVYIEKNKFGQQFKESRVKAEQGYGIVEEPDLLKEALLEGVMKKASSWYSVRDESEDDGWRAVAQGSESVIYWLRENKSEVKEKLNEQN